MLEPFAGLEVKCDLFGKNGAHKSRLETPYQLSSAMSVERVLKFAKEGFPVLFVFAPGKRYLYRSKDDCKFNFISLPMGGY